MRDQALDTGRGGTRPTERTVQVPLPRAGTVPEGLEAGGTPGRALSSQWVPGRSRPRLRLQCQGPAGWGTQGASQRALESGGWQCPTAPLWQAYQAVLSQSGWVWPVGGGPRMEGSSARVCAGLTGLGPRACQTESWAGV